MTGCPAGRARTASRCCSLGEEAVKIISAQATAETLRLEKSPGQKVRLPGALGRITCTMNDARKFSAQPFDALIVGAGMAGLSAAAALQRTGRDVVLIDKARAVGGRMATRRIGSATFDHGAQFITARTPRFASAIAHWQEIGVTEEWSRGFTEEADGHPRWRGRPGMAAVAKQLAWDFDIFLDTEIEAIRRAEDHWIVETAAGENFQARAIVLTPPVPQSLALLEAGKVAMSAKMRARLTSIRYERCLAVMAVLAGPSRVPAPGGFAPPAGPISWIADNQQKGISEEPAVTIHASPAFSLEHWERDRQESGQILLHAAREWLGAEVTTFQVHGWRYSKPMEVDADPCAVLSETPPLILAGDAFAGPRVEGAALSGWAAAKAIMRAEKTTPQFHFA